MKRKYFKARRKPRGFVPKPTDFWGFSIKNGKIGYAEIRRQLPASLYRRIKKRRPLFVYEWRDTETDFRVEIETSLNPKNGLLYLGSENPVFIIKHYDLKAVSNELPPDELNDGEVLEWRKYIEEDGSFLLYLRREVGKAFRLHELRPVCCVETVYVRHQGFTCSKCKKVFTVPDAYDFSSEQCNLQTESQIETKFAQAET